MSQNTNLPPAGHARQEELKKRADTLEVMGEELAKKADLHAFDLDKVQPENEIIQHLDMRTFEFRPEGMLPEYHYIWINRNRREAVDEAKARARTWYSTRGQRAPVTGYEVVTRGMPEWDANKELQHADGGLVIGDIMLMRIKREYKEVIDRNIEIQKQTREKGILNTAQSLLQMADRSGGRVRVESFNTTPRQWASARGRVHTSSHEG